MEMVLDLQIYHLQSYAGNAGVATYAQTAGIATLAENLTGSPAITISSATVGSEPDDSVVKHLQK